MIYAEEGKSLGVKTISTKLYREEFTRLQYHCKSNGETINSFLKRIILSEINNPQPIKIAGENKFEYDIMKDNFNWKVVLDEGSIIEIDKDIPAETIEQFFYSITNAVDKRKSILKKLKKESVSIPNNLMRKKDEK